MPEIKVNRKRTPTYEEIKQFIAWMLKPENKEWIDKASNAKVSQVFEEESGLKMSVSFIGMNRKSWVLINGLPYEKNKIPYELLKSEKFWPMFKDIWIE